MSDKDLKISLGSLLFLQFNEKMNKKLDTSKIVKLCLI